MKNDLLDESTWNFIPFALIFIGGGLLVFWVFYSAFRRVVKLIDKFKRK